MSDECDDQAYLRDRLGKGARYDSVSAPARELLWARRGTAYFARALQGLTDRELSGPSIIPGWSKGRVVGYVGYHARHLAKILERVRGILTTDEGDAGDLYSLLANAATLPPEALRNLFRHAEVHLNVEWRDLTNENWSNLIQRSGTQTVPVSSTVWERCRVVWLHSTSISEAASFRDFPAMLLDALAVDLIRSISTANVPAFKLAPIDRPTDFIVGEGDGPTIEGAMADIVGWLAGRGRCRLSSSTGEYPTLGPERIQIFFPTTL